MAEESLAARVQRLEDERAVVRTLYQYAHGLDYGPEEAFLDVFTEDGKWMRVEGRYGAQTVEGHSGFRKMYQRHTHAPDYFHKHMILNPCVEVDGDRATVRFYLVYVAEHPDGPYVRAFSRCNDVMVRCPDGRWRVKERKAELEAWSPVEFPPSSWTGLPDVVR